MLIPGKRLPSLGGPEAGFFYCRLIIREKHAAARGGDNLIAIEGNRIILSERSGHASLIPGA